MFCLRALPFALVLVGLFGCGGEDGSSGGEPAASPYAVLDQANPEILAELRKHWPESGSTYFIRDLNEKPLGRAIQRAAKEAPLALLKLLTERKSLGGVTTGWYYNDEEQEPVGWQIAARRDASLNPMLVEILRDRSLHIESRRTAAIALCFEGNEAALEPLVDLALDTGENVNFREQVLIRLHRIGRPLPERVKALLHLPFGDLDRVLAASLCCTGDLEAPSLLLETLSEPLSGRRDRFNVDPLLVLTLEGVGAHMESGEGRAEVSELRRELAEGPQTSVRSSGKHDRSWWLEQHAKQREEWVASQTGRLAAVTPWFREWLAESPERMDSDYERLRRKYFEGDRSRERAVESLEGLYRTGEAELDFGAASLLLCASLGGDRDRELWRLFAIGNTVRGRLDAADGPEAKLAAVDACLLLRRRLSLPANDLEPGGSSFLPRILHEQDGSALGLANLYLAVAERAGIPLFAVLEGESLRVRYREGKQVWQLGPPAGEPLLSFARASWAVVPLDDADREPLSRLQVLSILRSRFAELFRRRGDHLLSQKLAETAIRLWDRNGQAHRVLLLATYQLEPDSDERVLAGIRDAAKLPLFGGSANVDVAELLFSLSQWEDAYDAYDGLLREYPELRAAAAMRASCLSRMGRAKEALISLNAMLERTPNDLGLRALRIQTLVIAEDSAWQKDLSSIEDPVREPRLHLAAAAALIAEIPGRQPEPEQALALLDEIVALGEQEFKDRTDFKDMTEEEAEKLLRDGPPVDPLAASSAAFKAAQRNYFLIRADALHQKGDRAAAILSLQRAEALGDVDRYARKLRGKLWPK